MDDSTAETVLALQLEDLATILAADKETSEDGTGNSDQRTAIKLYRDQLQDRARFLADRRMSLSIIRAVQEDEAVLRTSTAREVAETNDRQVAQRLAGVQPSQRRMLMAPRQEDVSEATVAHITTYNTIAPIPASSIFPVCSSDFHQDHPENNLKKRRRRTVENTEDTASEDERAVKRSRGVIDKPTPNIPDQIVTSDIPTGPTRKRKRSIGDNARSSEQAVASDPHVTTSCAHPSTIGEEPGIGEDVTGQGQDSIASESSKRLRTEPPSETASDRESGCVVCGDFGLYTDLVETPCSHEYCRGCLTAFFEAAVKDGSIFPPRCCGQEVSLGMAATFLSQELLSKVTERTQEEATPNATYCSKPTCSVYIPLSSIELGHGICRRCGTRTCCRCKKIAHFDACIEDHDLECVRELARKEGWQACYKCHAMIELNFGCNHMT